MLRREDEGLVEKATVVGRAGEDIGRVRRVYADRTSGAPEWATVRVAGPEGEVERFVPLAEAELDVDRVVVPYSREQVLSAPPFDPDAGALHGRDESDLYLHYGIAAPDLVGQPELPQLPPGTEAGEFLDGVAADDSAPRR